MSKAITFIDFLSRARKHHADKYKYSQSEFFGIKSKISITCEKHGVFYQVAEHHANGHGCRKCGSERSAAIRAMSWDDFVREANLIHGNKYSYVKCDDFRTTSKVTIVCMKHGEFTRKAGKHLSVNSGCTVCSGRNPTNSSKPIGLGYFLDKSSKIHGDRYDYSKVELSNCRDKVIITCKLHGDFEQVAYEHYIGKGCRMCGYISANKKKKNDGTIYSYSRTKYIEMANAKTDGMSNLYIVRMKSEDESFIKIGICMHGLKRRFKKGFPYEISDSIVIRMEAGKAWDAEKHLHRMLKHLSYKPEIKFMGSTECFSDLNQDSMNMIGEIKCQQR